MQFSQLMMQCEHIKSLDIGHCKNLMTSDLMTNVLRINGIAQIKHRVAPTANLFYIQNKIMYKLSSITSRSNSTNHQTGA